MLLQLQSHRQRVSPLPLSPLLQQRRRPRQRQQLQKSRPRPGRKRRQKQWLTGRRRGRQWQRESAMRQLLHTHRHCSPQIGQRSPLVRSSSGRQQRLTALIRTVQKDSITTLHPTTTSAATGVSLTPSLTHRWCWSRTPGKVTAGPVSTAVFLTPTSVTTRLWKQVSFTGGETTVTTPLGFGAKRPMCSTSPLQMSAKQSWMWTWVRGRCHWAEHSTCSPTTCPVTPRGWTKGCSSIPTTSLSPLQITPLSKASHGINTLRSFRGSQRWSSRTGTGISFSPEFSKGTQTCYAFWFTPLLLSSSTSTQGRPGTVVLSPPQERESSKTTWWTWSNTR